jgi:hypothetical protein
MRPLAALTLLMFTAATPMFGLVRHVKGQVTIEDENHQPFPAPAVPGELTVRFFSVRDDNTRVPCGSSIVSSNTLQITECQIPETCGPDTRLVADITMLPDAGWKQDPRPTTIAHCRDKCSFELVMIRPRNPPKEVRRENYNRGVALLSGKSVDTAVFYLREASLGNLAYASASADVLEKSGKQQYAYTVLDAVDADKLEVSDKATFQVLMRKAHAARAANNVPDAIAVYADAQEVFPNNRQALSFAFATIADAAGSSDTPHMANYLDKNPSVKESFTRLYANSNLVKSPTKHIESKQAIRSVRAHVMTIPDMPIQPSRGTARDF